MIGPRSPRCRAEHLALLVMTLFCAFLIATRTDRPNYTCPPPIEVCSQAPETITKISETAAPSTGETITRQPTASSTKRRTWYEVAATTPTDKITAHAYDVAYERYLAPFLNKGSIKLLEIGLGCDMAYGPGASLKVWLEYFKDIKLNLHFMEYNRACAEKWQPQYPHVKFHIGDQASFVDLQKVIDDSGGDFDVIIDDGGHTMKQQIHTLEFMLPKALKPGGLFVLEDLHTSFQSNFNSDYGTNRTTEFIYKIIDDIHKARQFTSAQVPRNNWLYRQILGVHCFREVCVFEKMPLPSELSPSMRPNQDKP